MCVFFLSSILPGFLCPDRRQPAGFSQQLLLFSIGDGRRPISFFDVRAKRQNAFVLQELDRPFSVLSPAVFGKRRTICLTVKTVHANVFRLADHHYRYHRMLTASDFRAPKHKKRSNAFAIRIIRFEKSQDMRYNFEL